MWGRFCLYWPFGRLGLRGVLIPAAEIRNDDSQEAHQRTLDTAQALAHAATQQRGLKRTLLVGFDYARTDVARTGDAPGIDENLAGLISCNDDGLLAQSLGLVTVMFGQHSEGRATPRVD